MAVTDVVLTSRSGSFGRTREYTLVYRVVTNDVNDGPYIAAAGTGWSINSTYVCGNESDAGAYCNSIQPAQADEDGHDWDVTVSFGEQVQGNTNPLLEPPTEEWEGVRTEEPFDRDVDGKPCVNPVGDPFLEPLVRDRSRPILRITRNEALFPAQTYLYSDAINADAFRGAPPGTVKCLPIRSRKVSNAEFGDYYEVSYEFEYNPSGWNRKVLAAGLRAKGSDGKVRKVLNDDGTEVTDPVPLDKSGRKLRPGGTPVYLEFKPYNKVPFAPLGL